MKIIEGVLGGIGSNLKYLGLDNIVDFFLFIVFLFSYSFALRSELNTSTSNANLKIGEHIGNM